MWLPVFCRQKWDQEPTFSMQKKQNHMIPLLFHCGVSDFQRCNVVLFVGMHDRNLYLEVVQNLKEKLLFVIWMIRLAFLFKHDLIWCYDTERRLLYASNIIHIFRSVKAIKDRGTNQPNFVNVPKIMRKNLAWSMFKNHLHVSIIAQLRCPCQHYRLWFIYIHISI